MPQPLTTPSLPPALDSINPAALALSAARSASLSQRVWAATSIQRRVELLRAFRGLLATHGQRLAETSAAPRHRPVAESLTAEVIPLADACKFLERNAAQLLAPRSLGRSGRPFWLGGVESEVRREPLGVMLVIAPSNYPLFIPGVQVLQALAAGNAVLIKPGARGSRAAQALADLLHHAGFDHRLVQVLPEATEAVRGALEGGVAKVFLTGSAATGAAVQAELAPRLIPATMELSGCDAVFICADADLDLTVRALTFGLRLNNGATCIAPRRIFVHQSVATEFEGRLAAALQAESATQAPLALKPELQIILNDALAQGAHLLSGKVLATGDCIPPLVVAGASTSMRLLHEDVFAPVMSLVTVADDLEALEKSRQCPYALAATVFTEDRTRANHLARHIHAGLVIVNDMIVPSADPRIPFGGRGRSGFGVTRGAEGLLEMTAPKVITVRRGKFLPHLDAPRADDTELFSHYLIAAHGCGWRKRFAAMKNLFRLLALRGRRSTLHNSNTPTSHSL
jgi:acyl-CoA reductase-like NAD-dependent aldehyde dehydrogenase